MSLQSYYTIYVGKTGNPTHHKEDEMQIPRKWRPILELAYAYTTASIQREFMNLSILQNLVNDHDVLLNSIRNDLERLSDLNNEEFISKIDEISNRLGDLDPDTLRDLSYTYTLLRTQIAQDNAYAYAYKLYELGINRSYDKIAELKNNIRTNINNLYSYVDDYYVSKIYANENLALKSEVPTKVSDLPNDARYITQSALTEYALTSEVDSRIESIIGAAPSYLDTLGEIAYALGNNENLASYLISELDERATITYVTNELNKTSAWHDDIPIYDDSKIQYLINNGGLPDKYISIPSSETLLQTGESGRYLDIIFDTLRNLQKQISKIQRTFDKGLISMTNEDTHMARIVDEYSQIPESEPMWAVDPDTLSEITGAEFYIDNAHTLDGDVIVGDKKLIIGTTAVWNDNHTNITSGKPDNYLYNCPDAKEYVYITASSLDIKIILTNYVDDELNIIVDLSNKSNFNLPININHKYNILLCISRSVKNNQGKYVGNNFLFISIGDYFTGETIFEKYYNKNNGRYIDGYVVFNTDTSKNDENRYFISRIEFTDLELYRMTFYSKYQDFSNDVQPSVPDNDDTYDVAHITIRSVKNLEQLKKIKNQLLENELIYNDSNNCIYIIKNNEIKLISGGSSNIDPSDDVTGMEKIEILEWLEANGIVGLIEDVEAGSDIKLSLNNIGDITFINQLNEKYKFAVDSNGELKGTKITDRTLAERLAHENIIINENTDILEYNRRGIVGTLGQKISGKEITADLMLYADRVKIGNIYAPWKGSTVFGCTHGYIELENSSDTDFELENCWIHFARRSSAGVVDEHSLQLHGILPAGGTYLIRCKKYSDIEQSNTFIDVDSYDIEWITPEGELFDMYLEGDQNTFLLTYKCPGKDWVPTKKGENNTTVANTFDFNTPMTADGIDGFKKYHPCYIDSVSIVNHITANDASGKTDTFTWCGWKGSSVVINGKKKSWGASKGIYKNAKKLDALYKTTFELDPAKQAFQGLYWDSTKGSGADSSRVRSNTATDYQTVYLQKEFIEFPKSDAKYSVTMYKPMASYLGKNVCTDKTKLDPDKPNSVTVSFGIDMFTTRCFNWVSAGEFDEYIWIRKQGTTSWKRFESYTERSLTEVANSDPKQYEDSVYNKYLSTLSTATRPLRKEFTYITNNAVYARIKKSLPGTGPTKELQTRYTAHKCIIEIDNHPENITSPQTWEYVVGRGDKNKNIDPEHTSNVMTFKMYPKSYTPRLYQTTDQQGFHWIEYQTWAACAKKLNTIIQNQCNEENIIPVVLNTGDATQNGTRVNEWLDYYIGGECLFNHLEQMSIVGNNDLCDNDPEKLGTGDDIGKSNGFYHHVFYCYEVDETQIDGNKPSAITQNNKDVVFNTKGFKYLPLIKGNDNVIRYIPSFYWFGTDKYTFVMMNSELTYVNCGQWFNKKLIVNDSLSQTVNLYTGWTIPGASDSDKVQRYDDSFTTIYTMLYRIINEHITKKGSKETNASRKIQNLIVACHEMPFTVVTNANLKSDKMADDRSVNNKKSLVGSHMNKLNVNDNKSNYWFSRLLEHFNVKFVYGGHKHTYAITNELRENYLYTVKDENDNDVLKSSVLDEKMPMGETLVNDTAEFSTMVVKKQEGTSSDTWTQLKLDRDVLNQAVYNTLSETEKKKYEKIDGSKFPIMSYLCDAENNYNNNQLDSIVMTNSVFYPYYGVSVANNEDLGGVIYMMCQATGFKLKSNKELPGPGQRFSYIIPMTSPNESEEVVDTDKPSNQQLNPMYTEIRPDSHVAYLMRMLWIHKGDPHPTASNPDGSTPAVLSQSDYDTTHSDVGIEYLYRSNDLAASNRIYGAWTENRTTLLTW